MFDIQLENYDGGGEDIKSQASLSDIERLDISFDGGRLHLYLNGEEVLQTYFAGNDWSLTVAKND